jgi:hypothetical protein
MHVIGGVEMLVGELILVGYTRLGGYAADVWLVGIAAKVTTEHHFDVAMRDVIIGIAAADSSHRRAGERPGSRWRRRAEPAGQRKDDCLTAGSEERVSK